ncbi:MAG TPA: hypothetical protein VJV05_16590, partial [Pyrinomonadaceae bacterium]|nr:hypothetical protein [Pyrinomonadaceae bacterium]
LRTGDWDLVDGTLQCGGTGELKLEKPAQSFLCEVAMRFESEPNPDGIFALTFSSGVGKLELTLHPLSNVARLTVPDDSPGLPSIFKLPPGIDWSAWHELRIEVDRHRVSICLDNSALNIKTCLANGLDEVALRVENLELAIATSCLTEGFEELFVDDFPLEENGWTTSGEGSHRLTGGELVIKSDDEYEVTKGGGFESFEFAANFRPLDDYARYGLKLNGDSEQFQIEVDHQQRAVAIFGETTIDLLPHIEPTSFHQLRAVKLGSKVLCYFDDISLGEFNIGDGSATASIVCTGGKVGVEMIRLTGIEKPSRFA